MANLLSLSSLLLLLLLFSLFLLPDLSVSLNQEGILLLRVKHSLSDPAGALSDWSPSDSTPCNWTGVTCSPSGNSSSPTTVTSLDLSGLGLAGPFPPALCGLPHLAFLSLSDNLIDSELPSASLVGCSSVTHLDLSGNALVGPLPSRLPSLLPLLLYLDLTSNNFSGDVPPSFARFRNLRVLSLVGNFLSGPVPPFLADVSTLRVLNLSYNPFAPSPIPPSFGNLSALQVLWLAECNLVGGIPPSLGGLSSLLNLDLSYNSLSGVIPGSLAGLSSVVQIELYENKLSGPLPAGFSNLTELRSFDASTNQLTGRIPDDIFLVRKLESFHLYENNFTGPVPSTISRCKNLSSLRLFTNQLTGPLPADLGKSAPLSFIDVSDNFLTGEIPPGICDGGVLSQLLLIDNLFSGSLPESLGRCRTLTRVRLLNNRLSGEVPPVLWGLPHVSLLELAGNSFSGGISPAISGASNLSKLVISDNQFSGPIPEEIGALSKLYDFSAANNRLTGLLPMGLRNLAGLGHLDLRNNSLSGGLLTGVHTWKALTQLNLANNEFSGSIPSELGFLPVLNYLDLSGNKLTGEVPPELQNLKLNQFNLSNNQLSGTLPPLFSTSVYKNSFLGNPALCLDPNGMCPTKRSGVANRHGFIWLLRGVLMLSAFVLVAGAVWLYWFHKNLKKANSCVDMSKWMLTSFHKLGFSEYEIFDCLDEDNVIGTGASGKVYRAVLSNGQAVAVKKLWANSAKHAANQSIPDGFEAEVATLGKIRHKNIVKLWCCCTHRDCKLLVYEYMPNGSLGDLLHGTKGGLLDWPLRYKIALDAAEGLSYLHHDCVPPIVHRDVKSNNILLDADYAAKVADFGVAKAMDMGPKSMSVIAGSCGYIAPEYAYTLRVTEKSDIYSFGVVILELVAGRRPVDPEFGEKDLVKWVCCTLEQKGASDVVDPKLDICYREEICKVLNIGLLCTSSLPINRPSMRTVVKMLQEVAPEGSSIKPFAKKNPMPNLPPYFDEDASSDHWSHVQ